jgi:hypothetical protein
MINYILWYVAKKSLHKTLLQVAHIILNHFSYFLLLGISKTESIFFNFSYNMWFKS